MASFLITGSSRGLGLELVRNLVTLNQSTIGTIFASSRASSPSSDLAQVIQTSNGRVQYVQLDVNNQSSVEAATATVAQKLLPSKTGLDVLVNNAGIQISEQKASLVNVADLDTTLSTNVTSVHRVTAAFLPLLSQGQAKKIVNVSSTMGSIDLSVRSGVTYHPSYKISKAALNMLTVQYAAELGPQGFTVFAVSPGWLQTDLGGAYAHLKPADGARQVTDIILKSTPEKDNGSFRDIYIEGDSLYTGANPPW
jgi:NAD(P)-dependent dehydrogenase (short-subunit alcohol dehydrogenase family)